MKEIKMGCVNKPGCNSKAIEYILPTGIVKNIKNVEVKVSSMKKAA
jgi:hypothetical protein